jgi:subtilisin
MAEQKVGEPNGSANPGPTNAGAASTPRRAAQASGEPSSGPNEPHSGTAESNRAAGGGLTRRKRGYLIALRSSSGLAEPRADAIHEALAQMEDVEIVRRLRPKGFKGLDVGARLARDIIVARMDEQRAEALRQSAQVLVEPDARLGVSQVALATPWSSRAAPTPRRRQEIGFRILGAADQPLAGAGVTVFGRNFTSQAITDRSGTASVAIFDADGDLEDIHAVYVQPAADYWECFVQQPVLAAAEVNVVRLDPLFPASAKTAGENRAAWGRRLMHLDRLANGQAGAPLGAGVKIGLIDSGCDNSHPMLRHITRGVDLSRGDGAKDWTRDEIGQGTHCAGIIAGVGGSGPGVSGIAPGAEIHVFKLSPGGHVSDLIEALDQCIERHIDIACIGVSADQASELVVQKIIEARLAGVACIVAAGDDGGPVRFPAAAPGVLSVSAIGRLGEFPPQTHHGWTAIPELIGPSGLFAANFSAAGPQIGVCAPGVAVISSAPDGGFAARDGTAIAAAHVTGLAAQVLSRHPLFQGAYRGRDDARVHALFELIASSASPPVFDLARVGAGLPDLERVPGLGVPGDSWTKTAQTFGDFAFATGKDGFGDRLADAGVMPPPGYAASGALALMQLRVAGLI